MNDHLVYPNLVHCEVETIDTSHQSEASDSLARDCEAILNEPLPEPYDFAIENKVIEGKEERDSSSNNNSNNNGSPAAPPQYSAYSSAFNAPTDDGELRRSMLVKMKSVTGANESICEALLNRHNYDLEASVETFFTDSSRLLG